MQDEVKNLRISKLREYLMEIVEALKEDYNEMNVNFLSDKVESYSLDRIPVAPQVQNWIIDISQNRDVYSFRSRMNYSADTITNIENIGFYETFEQIINQKNKKHELPDIEGIQSISCLNCGTIAMATTHTAEFEIQIQIEYLNIEGTNASL